MIIDWMSQSCAGIELVACRVTVRLKYGRGSIAFRLMHIL